MKFSYFFVLRSRQFDAFEVTWIPSMLRLVPQGFTCLSTMLVVAVINRYLASLTMSARCPCFLPQCDVLTALAATATWSSKIPYVTNIVLPKSSSTGLFRSFFYELVDHLDVEVCWHFGSVFCSLAALIFLYLKYLLVISEHRVTQ